MYLDVIIRKVIQVAGVSLLERRYYNFASGITAVDNPVTKATDISVGTSDNPLEDPVITGTVTYQGTKLRILSIPGESQTTTATTSVIAQFTILEGTSVTVDFIAGMKAVGTTAKAGRWDGKGTWRRETGGSAAAVGSPEYGTAQETTAGDGVAFDLSGNVLSVLATAADADDRNWTCEMRVHETLATA